MNPRLASVVLSAAATQTLAGGLPDLWAHWMLDETGGVLAIDAARGYYGEFIGGPTLGLPGSYSPCENFAVSFDGADDRVLMNGQSAALNMGTGSFSVVTRFRKTTDSDDWMKIINKGMTSSGTPANAGYGLRIREGIIEFHLSDGAGIRRATASEPAKNGWHFVAGVLDRDAGEIRLYLDPADAGATASDTVTGLGSIDTNIEFAVAALDRAPVGGPSEFFEGWIDEVRLYRAALTGEQVLSLSQDTPCPADLAAPFGLLDLADVLGFITAFQAGDGEADLAPPCGLFDLEDVNAFVTVFVSGCAQTT